MPEGKEDSRLLHELNNHLAIIVGYINLVIADVDPQHNLYPDLVEIQRAAKAALVLGRRLTEIEDTDAQ